jgi:hypothetical protein
VGPFSPGECELVNSSSAFFESLLAIALDHDLRRSPDVDPGITPPECTVAVDKG